MDVEKVEYACRVEAVYSGDDLVVLVDLGVENLWKKQRVRLHGVDTPNGLNTADNTEAGKVRKMVRDLVLRRAGKLQVMSRNGSSWVCELTIETSDGAMCVNDHLKSLGYTFTKK